MGISLSSSEKKLIFKNKAYRAKGNESWKEEGKSVTEDLAVKKKCP